VIGERINNYTIMQPLGQGGMGTVYAAEHVLIGRRVAVKVLRREYAENNAVVARFINEARAAHAIRHPNIVQILDAGTLSDGRPYLMMELLEGQTLARRIADAGRLPIDEALAYAGQVASAVGAAHAQGIVHRDLKPDNIFLVDQPSPRQVKILDFGIAKLQRELGGSGHRTNTGALLGTPLYMSPEQCRGLSEDIDHRSDVYALGIILYEMLCGAPPFESRAFGDILMMQMSAPPPPPRAANDSIPPEIEAAILRALAKDKHERFASMADLRAALGQPSLGEQPTPMPLLPQEPSGAALASTLVLGPPAGPTAGASTLTLTASQIVESRDSAGPVRRRGVALAIGGVLAAALATAAVAMRPAARIQSARPAAAPREEPRPAPVTAPPPEAAPIAAATPPVPQQPVRRGTTRRRPPSAAVVKLSDQPAVMPAPIAAEPAVPAPPPPEVLPKPSKSKIEMW
jgi:serine/threonine protein kinase